MKILYLYDSDNQMAVQNQILAERICSAFESRNHETEIITQAGTPNATLNTLKNMLYFYSLGKNILPETDPDIIDRKGEEINEKISGKDFDALLLYGGLQAAKIETDKPIINMNDAPVDFFISKYDRFAGLSKNAREAAFDYQKKALEKSAINTFATRESVDFASGKYGVDKEKFAVIRPGPLNKIDLTRSDIENLAIERAEKPYKFIFISSDWKRNGGDRAVRVVAELVNIGINCELHVFGERPGLLDPYPEFVKYHGEFDNNPDSGRNYYDIFKNAAYLIHPSRAELEGFIYSEAAMLGVPTITSTTGIFREITDDGVNGRKFMNSDKIGEILEFIQNNMPGTENYRHLALNSYNKYKRELNWDNSVENLLERVSEF
jgi:glycosyltransferase involved in cell wall biosynthesis